MVKIKTKPPQIMEPEDRGVSASEAQDNVRAFPSVPESAGAGNLTQSDPQKQVSKHLVIPAATKLDFEVTGKLHGFKTDSAFFEAMFRFWKNHNVT